MWPYWIIEVQLPPWEHYILNWPHICGFYGRVSVLDAIIERSPFLTDGSLFISIIMVWLFLNFATFIPTSIEKQYNEST